MKNNELSPIILSSLYEDELYSLEKSSSLRKCASLGKNKKHCVILIKETQHIILSKPDLTFLENILKAIQYTLEDVLIINVNNENLTIKEIQKEHIPEKIILFNILPFEIGIQDKNVHKYEVMELENFNILTADSLQVITQDIDKKKALWISLQRMFKQ